MKLSNKQIYIISGIALVVVILLFVWTYYSGKKAGASPTGVKPPKDMVGADLTNEQLTFLNGLAVNLFNDMDGLNWKGWDYDLYKEVSLLSDNELVVLSNIFNEKYELNTEQTFVQWLKNENFATFTTTGWATQTVVNTIVSRYTQLGVS